MKTYFFWTQCPEKGSPQSKHQCLLLIHDIWLVAMTRITVFVFVRSLPAMEKDDKDHYKGETPHFFFIFFFIFLPQEWDPSFFLNFFTTRVSPLLGEVRSPTTLHISVAGLNTCNQNIAFGFTCVWWNHCGCIFSPPLFVCCVQTNLLQLKLAHRCPDFRSSAQPWWRQWWL